MGAWERCQPWLQAALDRAGGTHRLDDVLAAVLAGHMQFWPGARAAIITEIVQYPRLRACRYFLVGGKMADVLAMQPAIEAWARGHGCTRMCAIGRPGWRRVLTHWRALPHVLLEKDI